MLDLVGVLHNRIAFRLRCVAIWDLLWPNATISQNSTAIRRAVAYGKRIALTGISAD
jgi:hypothetical protein